MEGRAVGSKKRLVFRVFISLALILVMFFIPAGTLRWPQAWVFLTLYLSAVAGFYLSTKKRDPGLLKERMSPQKNVKAWDRRIVRIYSLLLAAMTVLVGLDAVRFRWSHLAPGWNVLGFGGLALAMLLALGSLFALIPAGFIVGLFILRTSLEDKTLQEELPGYKEYAQKVRYRLIPGVW